METYVAKNPEGALRKKRPIDSFIERTRPMTRSQNKGILDLSNITRTIDTREREKSRSNLRNPDTNENRPTADEIIPKGTRSEDVTQNRQRDQIANQKEFVREYKNMAPVELGLDLEKIVEGVLDMEISIPLRSLAGVSSAIQKEIRKQVTKSRQLLETDARKQMIMQKDEELIKLEDLKLVNASYLIMNSKETDTENFKVANDPILQYLSEEKAATSERIVVAKASEPLRAIYAKINHIGQEECLLDSGSMITSMSKEVAVQLGLTWDPSITINMESASNHLERTLGLARNVCLSTGGIDLFLQIHILENPPYRVLLGRPFDAFTTSVVRTKIDGTSDIVLTDPNTKRIAVVPTYERGIGPEELQRKKLEGF